MLNEILDVIIAIIIAIINLLNLQVVADKVFFLNYD